MKLLVLGASGRTGRLIVEDSLKRGHEVVALVRQESSVQAQQGLTVIEGTPTNADDLAMAMVGCDAVLVAMNNPRKSDSPWAQPVTKEKVMTKVAQNLVMLAEKAGIKRVIVLSAIGVADSYKDSMWLMKVMISKTNLRYAYDDHNGVDAVIKASDLDWTLVRATGLSNNEKDKQLVVGDMTSPKPGMMVRRSSIAKFMIDSAESGKYIKETPVVSEK